MANMCYQIVELYSQCRCLYYQHAVDKCAGYGRLGHSITRRTIQVGYTCEEHAKYVDGSSGEPKTVDQILEPRSRPTLKQAVNKIRETENDPRPEAKLKSRTRGSVPSSNPVSQYESIDLETLDDDTSTIVTSLFDGDVGASSITSAQGNEPPNATELLTNGLLYDTHLQYLWPQFFLRSSSKDSVHQQITRLILRYSLNLHNLAKNLEDSKDATLKIEAAKFVERKRRKLAQNICVHFRLSNHDVETSKSDVPGADEDLDDVHESWIPDQPEPQAFKSLQDFLFCTDPFYSFRENVRLLVEQPLYLPLRIRLFDSARKWFDSVCSAMVAPPLLPGKHRVYCICKLHDDYVESRPGALNELRLLLNQYGIVAKAAGDLEANQPASLSRIPSVSNAPDKGPKPSGSKYFDLRLPTYWQNQTKSELGKCRSRPAHAVPQPDEKHNFILTCIPFGRLISKLYQPEVCTIDSDQDFFSLLRVTYRSNRTPHPFSFIRRVKAVHFVQFEVHRTGLTDVRCQPSLPPAGSEDQYVCDPMPADLMPPIGPNLLVHLMENPTHAGVLPDLYKRIPKKLREKLTPCPRKGAAVGWGLAFIEGIDTFVFFLCGCIGFLVCFVVAIAWTLARSDVQGGFGIGAFLLTFTVFCGGLLHSSLSSSSATLSSH